MLKLRVLLVEDDNFKANMIIECLSNQAGYSFSFDTSETIRDALISIEDNAYDLILLDNALAGRKTTAGGGSPNQFPNGGIVILRNMVFDGIDTPVIIITQFPHVTLEGKDFPLNSIKNEIQKKLNFKLHGVVHFQRESEDWKTTLIELVRTL